MTNDHPLQAVLLADGPGHPGPDELMLFGQFVGSWDLDVTWYRDGVLTSSEKGEWHFGWILGGRAIQDVWIVPPRTAQKAGAEVYESGTSVRFYDATIGHWQSTWHGPVQGSVRLFKARPRGENIVLEGQQLEGRDIRWVFSNIRKDSFSWKFEQRSADAAGWDVLQAFECKRRS